MNSKITKQLKDKYDSIDQDVEVHLEGLLHSKPINYWDYIQTDALLNLQVQRTVFPDEKVFIMYHQISELLFKMILSEIEQVAKNDNITTEVFTDKIMRVSRYFDVLTSSFSIMKDGMDIDQYNKFRTTLTPASGFQSAQYRKVEFASTELINLIDKRFRDTIDRNSSYEHAFEHLYWQAAGKNHETGQKSAMISLFEEKYMDEFIDFMKKYNHKNIWNLFESLPSKEKNNLILINAMRHFDHTVNIKWVMEHFNTATKYLDGANKVEKATGGSDWKKYMHPKYQRRTFFPKLWTNEEMKNWGEQNLETHKILSNFDMLDF